MEIFSKDQITFLQNLKILENVSNKFIVNNSHYLLFVNLNSKKDELELTITDGISSIWQKQFGY